MKKQYFFTLLTTAFLLGQIHTHAQILVSQWDFNSTLPDDATGTGTLAPSTGSGTLSLLGGTTSTFVTGSGSSDTTASDNSALNVAGWAPQGTESGMRGLQFDVPTLGYENVVVQWDQRYTGTSSRFLEFQYSLDGTTFESLFTYENTVGASTWINGLSADLSDISGAGNNPDFAFRILSVFNPDPGDVYSAVSGNYGTTGTWRFDSVTVGGNMLAPVPEPEEYALMAAGALMAFGIYRKRREREQRA